MGLEVEQDERGMKVGQRKYVENKIKTIEISAKRKLETEEKLKREEETELRRAAGSLGWLSGGTRPDLSFERNSISRGFKNATVKDLIEASRILGKVEAVNSYYKILAEIGDPMRWWMEIFVDSSFANAEGEKSTAGYILFIKGGGEFAVPISWGSQVLQKVVTSTLGAETLAMEKFLKEGVFMREMLEEILGKKSKSIKLVVKTDNESLDEGIKGNKPIKDKRLRRYVEVIRQGLKDKDFWEVIKIPSELNLTVLMTLRRGLTTLL